VIATALFVASGGMAIAGALGAALVRNLFHAALLLGLCLLGTAGLYLFLGQHWLACVQVVVYVGGILVLILFATLFSADVMGAVQRRSPALLAAAGVVAVLAGGLVVRLAGAGHAAVTARPQRAAGTGSLEGAHGTTAGDLLLGDWFVPFFVAGLLLTIALVGAVVTVQRFRRPPAEVADA
jgi:NADH-quinone oxidoreductase subunit J